jgi:hypothetical protein
MENSLETLRSKGGAEGKLDGGDSGKTESMCEGNKEEEAKYRAT